MEKFSKNSDHEGICPVETSMWCWPFQIIIFSGYRLLSVVLMVFFDKTFNGGWRNSQINFKRKKEGGTEGGRERRTKGGREGGKKAGRPLHKTQILRLSKRFLSTCILKIITDILRVTNSERWLIILVSPWKITIEHAWKQLCKSAEFNCRSLALLPCILRLFYLEVFVVLI